MGNSPKHSNCSLCLFSKQTERKCSHCSYTVFHFKQMKQKITSKAPANTTIHCIIDLATELLSNNTWYLWDNRLLPQTFSLLPSNTLMGNSLLHTALYVLHRESAAIFRSRPLSFFTFVVSWKKKSAVNIKHFLYQRERFFSLWVKMNHKTLSLCSLRWPEMVYLGEYPCMRQHIDSLHQFLTHRFLWLSLQKYDLKGVPQNIVMTHQRLLA